MFVIIANKGMIARCQSKCQQHTKAGGEKRGMLFPPPAMKTTNKKGYTPSNTLPRSCVTRDMRSKRRTTQTTYKNALRMPHYGRRTTKPALRIRATRTSFYQPTCTIATTIAYSLFHLRCTSAQVHSKAVLALVLQGGSARHVACVPTFPFYSSQRPTPGTVTSSQQQSRQRTVQNGRDQVY